MSSWLCISEVPADKYPVRIELQERHWGEATVWWTFAMNISDTYVLSDGKRRGTIELRDGSHMPLLQAGEKHWVSNGYAYMPSQG